jgi:alanyl-tRNA synthetase
MQFPQAIEDMCREQLGQALRVYSQEVPLARARNINGLRAVFGEVRTGPPAFYVRSAGFLAGQPCHSRTT